MKNNRNLINEVLSDIAHDMSDEEVLKLLAESKVSENPESSRKKTIPLAQKPPMPLQNLREAGRLYCPSWWF